MSFEVNNQVLNFDVKKEQLNSGTMLIRNDIARIC